MASLVKGLDRKTMISGLGLQLQSEKHQKGVKDKVKQIVDYLKDTKGQHDGWACKYRVTHHVGPNQTSR